MVDSVNNFPFPKLKYDKYLTLDVMMHLMQFYANKFMFTINKEGRSFLLNNFITIRNEFTHSGLITFYWENSFGSFLQLEKLYYSVLSRKINNRALTIYVCFRSYDFKIYN